MCRTVGEWASNLTINAGIRWERQQIKDRLGETSIDIDDAWAPRLGVVWDPAGNGRSKIFGSYGRFFESIPLDINIRSFGGESSCFCNNFDPSPNNILPDRGESRSHVATGLAGHAG